MAAPKRTMMRRLALATHFCTSLGALAIARVRMPALGRSLRTGPRRWTLCTDRTAAGGFDKPAAPLMAIRAITVTVTHSTNTIIIMEHAGRVSFSCFGISPDTAIRVCIDLCVYMYSLTRSPRPCHVSYT